MLKTERLDQTISIKPPYDFKAGSILLVDKPLNWTSFDVVNKIRFRLKFLLKVKKIKVGHAGTLDPLATGLLIICTGKATKLLQSFQGLDKTYTGIITLGATTPSYDLETEIDTSYPTEHITPPLIESTRQQFLGPIEQMPPQFSAIKVKGVPVYKKAREGTKVELKTRNVSIHQFEFPKIDLPHLHFQVDCSKGTYIRSLAHDFGQALNSGGHLTQLCRTRIGDYHLEDAWNLEELVAYLEEMEKSSPPT